MFRQTSMCIPRLMGGNGYYYKKNEVNLNYINNSERWTEPQARPYTFLSVFSSTGVY